MKLKYLNIILLFLLCMSFSSCTKFGKNITIEGRVLNPITNEPISGVEVYLFKSEVNLDYYGGYKSIKETPLGQMVILN